MRAFIKFNRGVMKMPVPWQLWLLILVGANLIIPLFFTDHLEAVLVVGAFLGGVLLMTILTAVSGFTRLLGLGHILWLPLLYVLWTRLDQIPSDDLFGIWVRVLMMLNAVSLVIDAANVTRYVAGDRAETVEGL